MKDRLWTIEDPPETIGFQLARVVWDAPSAAKIIKAAHEQGFVVRGPYVLEEESEQ